MSSSALGTETSVNRLINGGFSFCALCEIDNLHNTKLFDGYLLMLSPQKKWKACANSWIIKLSI